MLLLSDMICSESDNSKNDIEMLKANIVIDLETLASWSDINNKACSAVLPSEEGRALLQFLWHTLTSQHHISYLGKKGG